MRLSFGLEMIDELHHFDCIWSIGVVEIGFKYPFELRPLVEATIKLFDGNLVNLDSAQTIPNIVSIRCSLAVGRVGELHQQL